MRHSRAVLAPALCSLIAGAAAALESGAGGADAAAGDERVHVVSGAEDTLWSIAAAMPRGDATVAQAMEAIRLANPDAFVDGDISRLRAGARLRLPRLAGTVTAGTEDPPHPAGEAGRAAERPRDPAASDAAVARAPADEASSAEPASPEPASEARDDLVAERDRLSAEQARLTASLAQSRREVSELQEQLAAARRAGAARQAPPERDQPSAAPRLLLGVAVFLIGLVAGVAGVLAWRRRAETLAPAAGGAPEGASGGAPDEDTPASPDSRTVAEAPARDAPARAQLANLAQRMQAQPGAAVAAAGRNTDAEPDEDFDAAAGGFDGDPLAFKLGLARAYVDIGDADSAREIIDEVRALGDASQRAEALALLARL